MMCGGIFYIQNTGDFFFLALYPGRGKRHPSPLLCLTNTSYLLRYCSDMHHLCEMMHIWAVSHRDDAYLSSISRDTAQICIISVRFYPIDPTKLVPTFLLCVALHYTLFTYFSQLDSQGHDLLISASLVKSIVFGIWMVFSDCLLEEWIAEWQEMGSHCRRHIIAIFLKVNPDSKMWMNW